MEKEDWQKLFETKLAQDCYLPQPIVVMQILQTFLNKDSSTTLQELIGQLRFVRDSLCESKNASVCVRSAGDMFTLFITRAPTEIENAVSFDEVREILKSRGEDFLGVYKTVHATIAKNTLGLFEDTYYCTIVTHSWNSCVLAVCLAACHSGVRLKVVVTKGVNTEHSEHMVEKLKAGGVTVELVPDASIAYYVQHCNMVMVGAEAVCPNGAIIARVGTATLAAVAHSLKRPVYCLVETYKFSTYHTPLDNACLKPEEIYGPVDCKSANPGPPKVDYTPPDHIKCLYTDVGPLNSCLLQETLSLMFT